MCVLLCVGLMPTMALATGGSVISNLSVTRDSETTATITFDSTQAGSVAIVFKNGDGTFGIYTHDLNGITVGTNVITYEYLTGSEAKEIAVYFGTDGSNFYTLFSSPNPLDEPGAVKGTIPAYHTCVGQGDWQYDPDNHWKLCGVCGNRVDETAHSGGTATCTAPAVCEVCQHAYGSVNSSNHSGKIVWTQTETTHSIAYYCCGAPVVAEEVHDWQNGVCSKCGYACQHSGGTATCTEKAVCELCGEEYGSVDADHHTGKVVWTQTATAHSGAYDCCGETVVADEPHAWADGVCSKCGYVCQHSGGTATCTEKAVCELCGEEYGSVDADHHTGKVVWTKTAAAHSSAYDCCGEAVVAEASHAYEWVIDKEATATEAGSRHEECTVCGYVGATEPIAATGTTETPSEPGQTDETPSAPADTADTNADDATDDVPKTGDTSSLTLWVALILLSSAGMAGIILYSRKRKVN